MGADKREPADIAAPSAEVEHVLAQLDALPTLPAAATRLLELTADPQTDAHDLSGVIESDPSLAARLLMLAGRADRNVQASSIHQVVVMLGFDVVRNLALSVTLFDLFARTPAGEPGVFDPSAFWKHSLAVASGARLLGEREANSESSLGKAAGESAFLCGLLHDLGKIALATCFPKAYDRALKRAEQCLLDIDEVERSTFGLDHMLAGRRLAERWRLPAMIREVIWLHHHAPEALPRVQCPQFLRLVRWANGLAHQLRIGDAGRRETACDVPAELRDLFEPGPVQEPFRDALIEEVGRRATLLGLDRVTSREVYQEAYTRATRELMRAQERLAETNRGLAERARGFEALGVLKQSLPDEPSHEDLCRSAVRALSHLTQDKPVGLVVYSAVRQTVWIGTAGAQAVEVHDWPAEQSPLIAPQPDGGLWGASPALTDVWLDRLGDAMPMRGGRYRRLARGADRGGVVCVDDAAPADSKALDVLCDWIETWLTEVEHRTDAQRMSDALSQINRRLADTRAEAARMRSLAMVGRMAAGAAHELNNPLTVISGRSQLLAAKSADEEIRQIASVVAEQADRASGIVSELMDFAKPAEPRPTVWSAAEMLHRVRAGWIAGGTLLEKEFELDISDAPLNVRADESQIRMLLDELIRNAIEAMRSAPARQLVINCWRDATDDKVAIRVEDNGCGMSAEVVEHAADPFFSHRVAGRGRGLGLSRAVRIAEMNGGTIRWSSMPCEGAQVLVLLGAA